MDANSGSDLRICQCFLKQDLMAVEWIECCVSVWTLLSPSNAPAISIDERGFLPF